MPALDTRTWFYPATAVCQPNLGYPGFRALPDAPGAPSNTMGGFAAGADIHDYNGDRGGRNIFDTPDHLAFSPGITDTMPCYTAGVGRSWYLKRRTDFKDWNGLTGIFWRPLSFTIEVDFNSIVLPYHGGYRDEIPNAAQPALLISSNIVTPYGAGAKQGSGVAVKAIVTDQTSHLEVVKASHIYEGFDGVETTGAALVLGAFTSVLSLTDITPAELATLVLRVETEQYSATGNALALYSHADNVATIKRIGLTPDPSAMRSSGKQSAALTTR